MKKSAFLVSLCVVFAVLVAGCGGGGGGVSGDSVATVDGTEVPKSQYDALISQAERSFKQQKRDFPSAGSQEYKQLQDQAITFLVQRVQFEQKADELGLEVSDGDVTKRLEEIKKQYFGNDEKRYQTQLKDTGLTEEQVQADVRAQLISQKLFEKVTADVKVTDPEIRQYYTLHPDQYTQPRSRDVRHILVKTKALADRLYTQLQDGADFTKLAKQYSDDPGSKDKGGRYDDVKQGQFVPEFDKVMFELKTDQISQPVKSQHGWHIIQPVSAIQPRKTTPLKDVNAVIQQQLLEQKRRDKMTKWVEDLKKEYAKKVDYRAGFEPPAVTTDSGAATTVGG